MEKEITIPKKATIENPLTGEGMPGEPFPAWLLLVLNHPEFASTRAQEAEALELARTFRKLEEGQKGHMGADPWSRACQVIRNSKMPFSPMINAQYHAQYADSLFGAVDYDPTAKANGKSEKISEPPLPPDVAVALNKEAAA